MTWCHPRGRKKIRGWAFWGCAIGWVFKPVVTRVGSGKVQPFHNFVLGWLRMHRA